MSEYIVSRIATSQHYWVVRADGKGRYLVGLNSRNIWMCSPEYCPAAQFGRKYSCKHIEIVKQYLKMTGSVFAVDMLSAAMEYVKMGWGVIPISPRGKRPLIIWEQYQHVRAEPAVVRKWWEYSAWRGANVGIITGQVSGIVVIDVDTAGITQASTLPFPETRRHSTGKGYHLIFKYPSGVIIKNRGGIWSGIDVRGDGGYIVAPPSIHETGVQYRLVNPLLPAEMPGWLVRRIVEGVEEKSHGHKRVL